MEVGVNVRNMDIKDGCNVGRNFSFSIYVLCSQRLRSVHFCTKKVIKEQILFHIFQSPSSFEMLISESSNRKQTVSSK